MSDTEWMKTCLLIATLADLSENDRREWRDEVLEDRPNEKDFCDLVLKTATV